MGEVRPEWAIGKHHNLGPARRGKVTCAACGAQYEEATMSRAEMEPCIDGIPTGVSEEEAKRNVMRAVQVNFPWMFPPVD